MTGYGSNDITFLEAFNHYMEAFELGLYGAHEIEHPVVFVIGAPRSGTTIMTQILSYGLGAGYIPNLAARFWRAPVTGLRLAREVLGPREHWSPGFASTHARTHEPDGIHEFGYFWKYWLDVGEDGIPSGDFWRMYRMRDAIANIVHELGAPWVCKGIYPAYVANEIDDPLDGNVLWVHVKRDYNDTCASILQAQRMTGRYPWFGWRPPNYKELEKTPGGAERVQEQVKWCHRSYGRISDITVQLERLAEDPDGVVEDVARVIGCTGMRPIPPGAIRAPKTYKL